MCKGVKSVRTNEDNEPLLFDGGVDIVAAFRVGYYGGESRCLVQASTESRSILISILISMRAIADTVGYVVVLGIENVRDGGDVGGDWA